MVLSVLLVWVPFIFSLSVLGYVSVSDFKTRMVSNLVWFFAYPIGCVMTLVSVVFNLVDVSVVLVSLICSLLLGVVMFFSGFYGGADVKALVFVGLTIPTLPIAFNPVLGAPALPLILMVFCNSTLLSMVWPLSIFILNLKDFLKGKHLFEEIKLSMREKVLLLFTARRIPLKELEKGLRHFPVETVIFQEGKPIKKLLHLMKAEINISKQVDNLKKHPELYKKGVLASPTIPSTAFFTLSLIVTTFCVLFF